MTVSTSVIVEVGPGGRALLRTADTIARQRRPAEGVVLVKSSAFASTPLVESVVSRLGALVVEPGPHPGVAWNAAVRRAGATYLVVLPAGLALHDSFIEQCESMFRGDALLAAVVPAIALRTADGSGNCTGSLRASARRRSSPTHEAFRRPLRFAATFGNRLADSMRRWRASLNMSSGSGSWLRGTGWNCCWSRAFHVRWGNADRSIRPAIDDTFNCFGRYRTARPSHPARHGRSARGP